MKMSNLAEFGMVAAEGNQLFADGTAAVGLPLAGLRVGHDPLHLNNRQQMSDLKSIRVVDH